MADDGWMSRTDWRRRGVCVAAALVMAMPAGMGGSPSMAATADPYLADEVPRAPGCIVLGRAWAGVKVAMVQRRLGTTHELDRYGPDTMNAVAAFQARRDLRVTGKVNRLTWKALGLNRPFCIDRFTVQPAVTTPTGAKKRVEAMITWARGQLGRSYIWGGAGPLGYDCSGLALQAMYAGGRVVPSVDTYRHQRQDFATAAAIYESGIRRVPLDERRRGDLVFYGPKGSITHMAIFLGKGRVLEAVRPQVRRSAIGGHGVPLKPRVVRPFGR